MSTLIEQIQATFPQTQFWIDSLNPTEIKYGLEHHVVGATSSPVWAGRLLSREYESSKIVLDRLIKANPGDSEDEIMWKLYLNYAKNNSDYFIDLNTDKRNGRYSMQTSIFDYNNQERILANAREIFALNHNMQVKIPATRAGIKAIEQATYEGISTMGTMCFTLDQALCVAKAQQKGLDKRCKEGLDNCRINPMCAFLLGLFDNSIKEYLDDNNLMLDSEITDQAGVLICKKILQVYTEKGYQTRLLTANFRNSYHFSELIGADIVMSAPMKWLKRLVNDKQIVVKDNAKIIDKRLIDALMIVPEFEKAFNEGSYGEKDFLYLNPMKKSILYFTSEYETGIKIVREALLQRK